MNPLGAPPDAGRAPSGNPRRLLHVFPSFEIGGAQARFARIAAGLGRGFQHTVVSLSGRDSAAGLLPVDAPVDFASPRDAEGSLLSRLASYRQVLRAHRPDVLVTYNWGAIEFALANLAYGVRHIHVEDGFGPEESTRQLGRRVWGRRLALRLSDVVVPSTTLRAVASDAWRVPASRLHYVPNGIAAWSPPAHASAPETIDGSVRIVWAGSLRTEKNPLRLLAAFAAAPECATLTIVGDGPEQATVMQEADRRGLSGRCRFLGRRLDVRDLMRQCHLLALSSDTEQMPLVVLEAMDAGLPVASTDVGDVRQMVAQANVPFVRGGSEAELAASITGLVRDADLRRSIGEANLAKVHEVYGEAAMIDAYRKLFSPPHAHIAADRSAARLRTG